MARGGRKTAYTEYVICSECEREVAGYTPKGGDGSQINTRRHVDHDTKQICKGSYHAGNLPRAERR